jgi:hypothetical protein
VFSYTDNSGKLLFTFWATIVIAGHSVILLSDGFEVILPKWGRIYNRKGRATLTIRLVLVNPAFSLREPYIDFLFSEKVIYLPLLLMEFLEVKQS